MTSKPDVITRNYCLAALVALITAAHVGHAEAQVPTTATIRVSGAMNQQRDAYGYFHFQAPELLVLWIIAPEHPKGSMSLQMRRRGAAFIQPGRYPVVVAGPSGPEDPSVFQVFMQHHAGDWAINSGVVTIERADTLSLSGRVSLRGSRPSNNKGAPTDTIRVEAQFTLRYDPFTVQMRQLVHERAEPHPPSSGEPSPPLPAAVRRLLPSGVPRPEHILEGSLRSDGRCVARLDGRPVISDTSRQRYMRDFALNTPVPKGQDWQILICGGLTFSFLAPAKKVVVPGRYSLVDREFPGVAAFTAVYSPTRPPLGDPFAVADLMGRAGVLEIQAADSARIIGRFRVTVQAAAWP